MNIRRSIIASMGFALAMNCLPASADVIISAVSISSPQGDLGGALSLVNIINQSSLSAPYTSGVTDFGTYVAGTTHSGLLGNGFTATETNGPQQFTLDLGSVKIINALAIWNTGFSIGAINTFALFSDNDDNFANGTTGALLDAIPLAFPGNPVPAQVFSFEPTATRFVHINALNTNNPPDSYGLGEVAFSATSPVPEPATLALVAAGIAGIWLARQQKRSR